MGSFLCLREFASFHLLSQISELNADYQRSLNGRHRNEIAQFLTLGEYRFFPEVMLSLRLSNGKENLDIVELFHKSLSAGDTWNKSVGGIQFSISQNVTKNIPNAFSRAFPGLLSPCWL